MILFASRNELKCFKVFFNYSQKFLNFVAFYSCFWTRGTAPQWKTMLFKWNFNNNDGGDRQHCLFRTNESFKRAMMSEQIFYLIWVRASMKTVKIHNSLHGAHWSLMLITFFICTANQLLNSNSFYVTLPFLVFLFFFMYFHPRLKTQALGKLSFFCNFINFNFYFWSNDWVSQISLVHTNLSMNGFSRLLSRPNQNEMLGMILFTLNSFFIIF